MSNSFIRKILVTLVCLWTAVGAFRVVAADYYVNPDPNPELASDDFDGSKAVREAGTLHGPRRTLKGAMAIKGLTAGDIVHAARGVYNEGVMPPISGWSTSNRVVVASGVGLVADEGADVTFIEGFVPPLEEGSSITNGGPNAVRCVGFNTSDKTGYVKGFTLRNGSVAIRKSSTKADGEWGGGVYYGTAIDCVITNCYAVRASAAYYATCIRCHMVGCGQVTGWSSYAGKTLSSAYCAMYGGLYDCLLEGDFYYVGRIVNSTVTGSMTSGNGENYVTVLNSYVGTDKGSVYTNCVLGSSVSSQSTCDAATKSRVNKTYSLDVFSRPLADASVIDAGNNDLYVYPENFAKEAGKDLAGRPRIANGTIDVGCYEHASMTFYADAENGNDGWDGLVATNAAPATSTQGPRRTLAAAMEIEGLGSGDVVCALPGTYADGEVWDATSKASNRVVVAAGVGLVSSAGPLATIIEGHMATDTASGLWADAVRGATLKAKAYMQGFTVQNGSTPTNVNGSAIWLDDNAAAIDCRIVNNKVGPDGRSAANNGVLIRCYIGGNAYATQSTGVGANGGNYYNCVVAKGGNLYSQGGMAANCTFLNGGSCAGSSTSGAKVMHSYNNLWIGAAPSAKNELHNCLVYCDGKKTYHDDAGVKTEETSAAPTLDAAYRPPAECATVDAGTPENYTTNFPALWSAFATCDYAGGQRVYNGTIDIGAGEYDVRGEAAAALGKNIAVSSLAADATVSSTGVTLPTGSMALTWGPTRNVQRKFNVQLVSDGALGALTVKTNGVVFAEVTSASQTFEFEHPLAGLDMTFDYAGDGQAILSQFLSQSGMLLIFR